VKQVTDEVHDKQTYLKQLYKCIRAKVKIAL
jgi:hypothetical protein